MTQSQLLIGCEGCLLCVVEGIVVGRRGQCCHGNLHTLLQPMACQHLECPRRSVSSHHNTSQNWSQHTFMKSYRAFYYHPSPSPLPHHPSTLPSPPLLPLSSLHLALVIPPPSPSPPVQVISCSSSLPLFGSPSSLHHIHV